MAANPLTPQQIREDLFMRRQKIVSEMGSVERIARQHAKGRMTIRERLDKLFDPGSFREIGTFAFSEIPECPRSHAGRRQDWRLGRDRWPSRNRLRR